VAGIIEVLKNNITVLQDGIEQYLMFETYGFEVIEYVITNQMLHRVAIHYTSGPFTLYEIIGEYLLIAKGDRSGEISAEPAEIFLIKVQAGMTIVSYKELNQ